MISFFEKITNSKINQASKLLDKPLVIFNIDGNNRNYTMFTLIDDHAAPAVFILMPDKKAYLLVSSIETAIPRKLKNLITIYPYGSSKGLFSILNEIIKPKTEIYVEFSLKYPSLDILSYGLYKKLKRYYKLKSSENILWNLRTFKTEEEIILIKKSVKITKDIFTRIENFITQDKTEEEIFYNIKKITDEFKVKFSFNPIIASGERAFDPHPGSYSKRKLKKNDLLIIDMGIYYYGYASDLTKTYKIDGDIKKEFFYSVNKTMVETLLDLDLSIITPYKLSKIMNNIAKKYQVESYLKHGYGHGLGIAVHDIYPLISGSSYSSKMKFAENMIFAFEPGFYTNKKSFRFENNYLIKNNYAKEL